MYIYYHTFGSNVNKKMRQMRTFYAFIVDPLPEALWMDLRTSFHPDPAARWVAPSLP